MRDLIPTEAIGPMLYRSWSDFPVHNFSYTLAKDIDNCGLATRYSRFFGLAPVIESAAMKFGICVEDAIKAHYLAEEDPQRQFALAWLQYREDKLKYSKSDGNWETLNNVGKFLMRVFLSEKKTLPLFKPEFSVVLPRDPKQVWYNGTRLEYIADCVSHPSEGDILIDFKTAGRSYPTKEEARGYPALDPQLRTGSLVSGIRTVCFIVFVKTKTPTIQVHFGNVTDYLLEQTDLWLREQHDKLTSGRLNMRAGVRFPDEHCLNCDFLPKCLGREDIAKQNLRQKQSKEVDDLFASLEE